MEKKKFNYISLACAVLALAVFAVSLGFFIKGQAIGNSTSELAPDFSELNVVKMYADDDIYLAGTDTGEVHCYDKEGERLWYITNPDGKFSVRDLQLFNDRIFVAFENRKILSFLSDEVSSDGEAIWEAESSQVYDLEDALPKTMYFGENSDYFAVIADDSAFTDTFLIALPVSVSAEDVGEDGIYYLFEHSLWTADRAYQGCAVVGDSIYYSTRTSDIGILRITENGEEHEETVIARYSAPFLALTGVEDGIAGFTNDGSLYVFEQLPIQADSKPLIYPITQEKINNDGVTAGGTCFYVRYTNGGVSVVDAMERSETVRISSSVNESVIMSSPDGFVLRYFKTGEPVRLTYYTNDLARMIQAYDNLSWLMIVGMVVGFLALLYCGALVYRPLGKIVNRKFVACGKAIAKHWVVYVSLIPTFVLLAIFYYYPIVFGFSLSFRDYLPGDHSIWVGFENFARVFKDDIFVSSIGSMFIFLAADLLKALIPPIIFAEAIFAVRNKSFSFWVRALLFIPGILPGVATSLVWAEGIFGAGQNGLINALGKLFVPSRANINFFAERGTATFAFIMFSFPWIGSYLIFYGAVSGIPSSMYEAAKLDGCGWLKRIVKLDLPMILPQIKYILITSFIGSIQNYGTIYVVRGTSGPVYTPALCMYSEIMQSNYGLASAQSVILFLFLMVATILNFRIQSDQS